MPDNLMFLTIALPLLIGGVVVVIAAIFVGGLVMNGMKNRQLLSKGVSAPAVILKVWETGVVMNEINPQIGLLLEVRPQKGAPFQAETKMFISMIQVPQFQPGVTLAVKYDPADPRKVAVDPTGGTALGGSPAGSAPSVDPSRTQAVQAMLEQMKSFEEDMRARGVAAPAKILTAGDMGVRVNGDNPLMTMQLQVEASDRAPFQAMAQGVVAATAVGKYQPGAKVWVKYDPNDPTKVMLDHS
ncbi:MAG: hypothetical protein M1482_09470 [Chloroflexi bacterium]|nr:hypothetical protein [Chloroflexota bacterium]